MDLIRFNCLISGVGPDKTTGKYNNISLELSYKVNIYIINYTQFLIPFWKMYLDSTKKNVQADEFVTFGKTLGNEDYSTKSATERYYFNMALYRIVTYINIV